MFDMHDQTLHVFFFSDIAMNLTLFSEDVM